MTAPVPPDANGLREAVEVALALLDEEVEPDLDEYEHRTQRVYNTLRRALLAASEAAPTAGERATGVIVPERQRCICGDICLDHCRACNHSGRDLEEPCIADPDWEPDDDDLARRESVTATPPAASEAAPTAGERDFDGGRLPHDSVAHKAADSFWFAEGCARCQRDRPATPPADDASEVSLTTVERHRLATCWNDADGKHKAARWDEVLYHVERIVAARESAAATRARAEGAVEALREAADDARKVYIECEATYRGSCRPYDQGVADAWDAAADGLRDRADSIARSDAAPHTGSKS